MDNEKHSLMYHDQKLGSKNKYDASLKLWNFIKEKKNSQVNEAAMHIHMIKYSYIV